MGYYDGNTVTAMWNYAQNFAMSDNSWGTTFGPSTPGALNLVAGNTFPATLFSKRPNGSPASASGNIANAATTGAVIGDPRPLLDDCVASNPKFQGVNQITMSGKNVGDLLNARGITWGWFQGGFAPTGVDTQGRAVCGQHHTGLVGDDAVVNAGAYQDGHAGYSDPIDEQIFVVDTINALMHSPEWNETAVVIAWDDSDGWYDHQMGTIVTQSN